MPTFVSSKMHLGALVAYNQVLCFLYPSQPVGETLPGLVLRMSFEFVCFLLVRVLVALTTSIFM